MARQKCFGKTSVKQKVQKKSASEKAHENLAPKTMPKQRKLAAETALKDAQEHIVQLTTALQDKTNQLGNTKERERYYRKKDKIAKDKIDQIKARETGLKNENSQQAEKIKDLVQEKQELISQLSREECMRSLEAQKAQDERSTSQKTIQALKKKIKRADKAKKNAVQRAEKRGWHKSRAYRSMSSKTYAVPTRKILRMLVMNGCSREAAGQVFSTIADLLGVKVKVASRRTVSRIILEGYIAAKMQIGYEIHQTQALTISADSTSNRGIDYESKHIAMRVPNYSSGAGSVDLTSAPKNRFLCVDSAAEHTAEAASNGFLSRIDEALDFYNRSPQAKLLQLTVRPRDFLRKLKGMNGDHASKEKSAARGIQERKRISALSDLGEDSLQTMEPSQLYPYLAAWNAKKIAQAGGADAWSMLSPVEQSLRDKEMMDELHLTLGQQEFAELTPEEQRELSLFIWSGCCMHKNENSFEGGNTEMKLEWAKRQLTAPIVLANKFNAATIRSILHPEASQPSAPLTEAELKALEQSTRGGVKTTALSGAIFNNKDDKKGQGDRHETYFRANVNPKYRRFPDTSNTRFGSHGDAAADLIQYLDSHISFINLIRLSKGTATLTNIEYNVLAALQDIPTITELSAMVLYSQAVCKPYMAIVRGSPSDNALDLGPLHCLVHEFINGILTNPSLLFSDDSSLSHVHGTLDGREWENPHAIAAVERLIPMLPHIEEITLGFFRGSLATWIRFSAEFAPGGLIDLASAEERHLAWMPTTNDANEGALGSYRVSMRSRPSMTLHQHNALAMVARNDTQAFMDAVLTSEDHTYIMREARRIDALHLESNRRREIVDFRMKVAQIRSDKETAAALKKKADFDRLSKVKLITDPDDIERYTVAQMGEQIDAFRLRGLEGVEPKSRYKLRPERLGYVIKLVAAWNALLGKNGGTPPQITPPPEKPHIQDDWEMDDLINNAEL